MTYVTFSKAQYRSNHEKKRILEEHFVDGLSISELARKYQIQPVTLYSWRKRFSDNQKESIGMSDSETQSNLKLLETENDQLRDQIKALKRTVANLAVDKDILQEAVEILKKRNASHRMSKSQKR